MKCNKLRQISTFLQVVKVKMPHTETWQRLTVNASETISIYFNFQVSQGDVATHLWSGENFHNGYIPNFIENTTMKTF